MDLSTIRKRLRHHQPAVVEHNGHSRAAVAIVLRERERTCDVLLIERSERADDPWSGHMAFPGGREDAADGELVQTAARETHEEVGIDLRASAQLLGRLDDVQAVARDRPLRMVIRPYVYALTHDVVPQPDRREVKSTVWLPLRFLTTPQAKGTYTRRLGGEAQDFPAFVYQGYRVWGLTYRMLTGFLDLLR
ncbi:MAG TPA: CoA pyrophosphatase [Candidatus Kryptonia bacterium]|nr:CoA pyrophosphatase [Candidatus Kryptonia bacterium]